MINGSGTFDQLILTATPGTSNQSFSIYDSTINTNYLENLFNISNNQAINNVTLELSFRYCMRGEIDSYS